MGCSTKRSNRHFLRVIRSRYRTDLRPGLSGRFCAIKCRLNCRRTRQKGLAISCERSGPIGNSGRIGVTVAIEYRWNEGQAERIAEIAAEFIRLKVDVIVTNAIAVPALKQATTVIPIVFAIAPDPVGGGLVASLARPGGNVTGQSIQATDLAGKRLELLREIVPHLRRMAIVFNADFSQTVAEADFVKTTARTLGLEVAPLEIRRADDIAPLSRRSTLRLTRFISSQMRSLPLTAAASLPLH
jgi:ABC transporter substrate binding protein